MCEKCRLMELFDEELARFETYDNDEAFSIARHRYALERHGESQQRAKVIAEREPFREQPPSREERIEKATEKIWHLIDRAANQSTVAKEEARAILTELMEEKP